MKNNTLYNLSLGLTILLTLAAFLMLLNWAATLINGASHLPALALVPWKTVCLLVVAGVNCTLRAELIVHKRQATA